MASPMAVSAGGASGGPLMVEGTMLDAGADAALPPKQLPPGMLSLLKVISKRLEARWRGNETAADIKWSEAIYNTEYHIKRRPPNEIEAVLATLDQAALQIVEQSFGERMPDLAEFAEAIVRTGTYDAEAVLGFIGGVVDLFLEVLWSQAEKAYGAPDGTVRWGQLMNHFIESPEIAMFEGTEVTAGLGGKARSSTERMPQMQKSDIVDCAKHPGTFIEKMYWIQHLDSLVTCEGTDSINFWTPSESLDAPKCIQTPELKNVPDCFDENDRPLYTVLACAWDGSQDLTALLSNRLLIVWRLRSREKFQFRQRIVYRLHANKTNESRQSKKESPWKVCIKPVDPKGESMELQSSNSAAGAKRSAADAGRSSSSTRKEAASPMDALEREERNMRLQMKDDRSAKDVSNQVDIWWNSQRKLWVTTDKDGKLCFWDLVSIESTTDPGPFQPLAEHAAHKRLVTAYQEIGPRKFVSASLDRTVVLWDSVNLSTEMRIEDPTAAVLDLAYLSNFYSLVSVGCEKRVYVWSIDSTAYRGLTAKLSGHQANLLQVSAAGERGRAFFTLDEAFVVIIWDVATLSSLQTFNASKQRPRLALCFSNLGRYCLAGRRFYFYEGNEMMALNYMGATPSKEQLAKSQKPVAGSFKERAKPRWCGLDALRGVVVSVTDAEVRVHARGDPSQSRVILCLNEGEVVTSYATMDSMHLAVLGTSKGAIHFVKSRSGCALKVYEGRLDGEAWEPGANATSGGGGGGGAPIAAEVDGDGRARASQGGANARIGSSSPGGQARSSVSPAGQGRPSLTQGVSPVATAAGPDALALAVKPKSSTGSLPLASRGMLGMHLGNESRGGGRLSDAGGHDGSSAGDGTDNQAEEEEKEQERQEIRGVVHMGYCEADARRALRERRKLADAQREWDADETAQANFKNADAETREKTLEDVKTGNMNANIENAVEKLLSGAVATTGTEDPLPVRMPLRTMDGSKEGDEDKSRPRRISVSHNAPTPEEIAKGLTRKIQCVLPCEEQKRIYVGTDEGQVLVCNCDPNFTIVRWLTQPGPNVAAVTCMDVVYEDHPDGEWGLLSVGTQEGSAHLYGLPNLRLAGSINIGRVLPEVNTESSDLQLRHARLLWMPSGSATSAQFPLAVLTIDERSRFRFWGIRLHSQSGKLEELALLLDGGQLTEIKEALVDPNAAPDPAEGELQDPAKEAAKKAAAAKDAKALEAKGPEAEQNRPTARITTVCTVKGQVVLPMSAVPGSQLPGTEAVAAAAPPTPATSAAFAALAAAFAASGGSAGEESDKGVDTEAAKERARVKFDVTKDSDRAADSSEGTDEDDRPETLEWRKARNKVRPRTPDAGHDFDGVQYPPKVATADGSSYIFFGDAVGRIWCLDAVGSAVAAHEERPPLTVLLDENDMPKSRQRPGSVRFGTAGSFAGGSTGGRRPSFTQFGSAQMGMSTGLAKQAIPTPAPEALKIATSWQAHESSIVALTPTTSPPALVSTDSDKQVKVWSTSGDLWGHFQMAGVDPGLTFLWPPPHVIAAQHALMRIAKSLCKRMGLRTSGVSTENIAANVKKNREYRKEKKRREKASKEKDASSGGEKKSKARSKPEKKVVVVSDDREPTPKKNKKKKKDASSESESALFMTEPPSTKSTSLGDPTASESETGGGTTADDSSEMPPRPTPASQARAADGETPGAGDLEASRELIDENIEDGGIADGEAGGDFDDNATPKAAAKAFNRKQMMDMVRNHGFSSGFQSYGQFMSSKNSAASPSGSRRRASESLGQLEVNRSSFFGREASDFGVDFITRKEPVQWEKSTRGMGARSSSEGALLRFAQTAVRDAKRAVYDDLGVDVSKTAMWQMRKPSFIARLDVRPEDRTGKAAPRRKGDNEVVLCPCHFICRVHLEKDGKNWRLDSEGFERLKAMKRYMSDLSNRHRGNETTASKKVETLALKSETPLPTGEEPVVQQVQTPVQKVAIIKMSSSQRRSALVESAWASVSRQDSQTRR